MQDVFNWDNGKALVVDDIEYTQPLNYKLECACYIGGAVTFVDCITPRNFICEDPPATTPATG